MTGHKRPDLLTQSMIGFPSFQAREARSGNLRACKFPGFEKVEVAEEAKEPERADRYRHGKGCPVTA